MTKPSLLPADRIGLSREEAAAYIGISQNTFDALVDRSLMPKAKKIGSRRIWSRRLVEIAFESLDEPYGRDKSDGADQDAELGRPPWEDRA